MKTNLFIPLFASLAMMAVASIPNTQAQQRSEARMAQMLKRFPEADANGDGNLA